MRKLILLLLISCSQTPPKQAPQQYPPDGLVTVPTALEQARSSYLKGCVDAFVNFKVKGSFEHCRDKAVLHHKELEALMDQIPEETTPKAP